MQSTTRFHDSIANPSFQEAYLISHHPVTFHPTDRVFNTDTNRHYQGLYCTISQRPFSEGGGAYAK
jgi:hypothetical protein